MEEEEGMRFIEPSGRYVVDQWIGRGGSLCSAAQYRTGGGCMNPSQCPYIIIGGQVDAWRGCGSVQLIYGGNTAMHYLTSRYRIKFIVLPRRSSGGWRESAECPPLRPGCDWTATVGSTRRCYLQPHRFAQRLDCDVATRMVALLLSLYHCLHYNSCVLFLCTFV
jgi:hypothetical protein